ncbi:MAG: ComEC/Rec2 family competence protein [Eubacteriales bacterium]
MRKHFFIAAAAAAAAALCGVLFDSGPVFLLIAPLAGIGAWCICRLVPALDLRGFPRDAAAFFIGFCAMALWFYLYTETLGASAAGYAGSCTSVELRAADFPSEGNITARVLTDGKPSPYLVRLKAYCDLPEIEPGTVIRAKVFFRSPEDTGRFRSKTYFRAENIYLTGYLTEDAALVSEGGATLFNWHKYVRRAALSRCSDLFGDNAFLMRALLFGDKSGFSDEFSSDASSAGVSHIFAVSGMHLSFCVSAVLLLGKRRWTHFTAIATVLIFMAVTGFEPSVVRSGVMQITVLTAWLLGRDSDSYSSLAFSLVLLLCLNPCSIGDIGLQFSFCAVLGILMTGEKLREKLSAPFQKLSKFPSKFFRAAANAAAVSISSAVFTAPLTMLYFKKLSLVSVFSNILLSWVTSAVFVLGMVSLLVSCIWFPLGLIPAFFVRLGAEVLEIMIHFFARLPFSVLGTDGALVSAAILAAYVSGILLFALKVRRPALKTAAATLGAAALSLALGFVLLRGELRVTSVDVGMGSCTLLQNKGAAVAVDCTSSTGGAAAALTDAMQAKNIRKLDLLIVTNVTSPDSSGADELIASGRVRRLALAAYSGERSDADALISLAESRGVPVDVISCDTVYLFGEARLSVFVPLSSGSSRGTAAVLCEYGGASVFIPGYTSAESQRRLLATRDIPELELLFAGNCGRDSFTDPELLRLSENGLLVISGSEKKDVPSPALLSDAERLGLKTLRTASSGDVGIVFRRGKIYIKD